MTCKTSIARQIDSIPKVTDKSNMELMESPYKVASQLNIGL